MHEIDIQSQRLALIVLNCASILLSNSIQSFLPHDAMHKHCLCRHAVSLCVCLSVCLSCLWIMWKRINVSSKFCHHSGFSVPNGVVIFRREPPNGGVKCKGGMKKSRFSTYIGLYWTFVVWCLQHIYRVTLIGVFLGHFRDMHINAFI